MKNLYFCTVVACFICGLTLFIIFLIFKKDWSVYSIIPLSLCIILVVADGVKEIVQEKRNKKAP